MKSVRTGFMSMVLCAMGLAFVGVDSALAAATCGSKRCCEQSGSGSYVCVEWSGTGDPLEGTDFTFTFTDIHKPDIKLVTGGTTWTVWSQEGESDDDADSLGDISVEPTASSSADFSLKIENPDSTSGEGATTVESIVLDGAGATNWSGGSNITGMSITSDVNGGLVVVQDSGGGDGKVIGYSNI